MSRETAVDASANSYPEASARHSTGLVTDLGVIHVSVSPSSVVRSFFAAWLGPTPDELGSFFSDDAQWVDGPQGVRRGAATIQRELFAQLTAVDGVAVDVKTLVSEGRTVMVEQTHRSTIHGVAISSVVMAVFELDEAGRIQQWREAYDLKSALNQIEAAHRAEV
jgi:limonene-1,2-epoxide hydrolase